MPKKCIGLCSEIYLQKMPLQTRRQITYLGNARISFRNILPWRSWCNRCCFDAQMCFEPKNVVTENRIRMLFWKVVYVSRFEFHLWGRDPHFVGIAKSS